MIHILDRYVTRTFLGPFLFIFSVLFFIFIVQFAWQEFDQFLGKGLTLIQILKLLFYLGITIIQWVLPLTILLASIMTFGQLGETYELTAMKASGISLMRIMLPLFIVVGLMAIGLFHFSNKVVPDFQNKAKNMLINISQANPALTFESGKFINEIPNYSMRINDISGENSDEFSDIIIHSMLPLNQNIQTIIANKGTLQPTGNKFYLKFELYEGYVYEDDNKNKSVDELKRQPYRVIKFDTLIKMFDVKELVDKSIDENSDTQNYRALDYRELSDTIQIMDSTIVSFSEKSAENSLLQLIPNLHEMDKLDFDEEFFPTVELDALDENARADLARDAIANMDRVEKSMQPDILNNQYRMKVKNKAVMYQQNMVTYSVTCLIFFLIGASLGSIIRKGGLGMPVVVAIIVFIIFFTLQSIFYQSSKNDLLNPYLASWLPNLIILPFAMFLTIKAQNDSQVLDLGRYKEMVQKISSKFVKQKNTEHTRYQ